MLFWAAGCTPTTINGAYCEMAQVVRGQIRINGDENQFTALSGSRVTTLTVDGSQNRVVVEDGAIIIKARVDGDGNKVVCPAGQQVQYVAKGLYNQLTYRSPSQVGGVQSRQR
jgi:hypothetical protein